MLTKSLLKQSDMLKNMLKNIMLIYATVNTKKHV